MPKSVLSKRLPVRRYRITMAFTDQIRGGTPKSDSVIESWIKTHVTDESAVERIVAETKEAMAPATNVDETVDEAKKVVANGFKSDENGLYVEGRCIMAMLKESANIIKTELNITALRNRLVEQWYVEEQTCPLVRQDTGERIKEPDGTAEGVVHAMTRVGMIHALKEVDYIKGAQVSFTLRCYDLGFATKTKSVVPYLDVLEYVLDHAEWNGFHAERSQQHGRFVVTELVEIDRDNQPLKPIED